MRISASGVGTARSWRRNALCRARRPSAPPGSGALDADASPVAMLSDLVFPQRAVEQSDGSDRHGQQGRDGQYPDQPHRDEAIGEIGGVIEDFTEPAQARLAVVAEERQCDVTSDGLA